MPGVSGEIRGATDDCLGLTDLHIEWEHWEFVPNMLRIAFQRRRKLPRRLRMSKRLRYDKTLRRMSSAIVWTDEAWLGQTMRQR